MESQQSTDVRGIYAGIYAGETVRVEAASEALRDMYGGAVVVDVAWATVALDGTGVERLITLLQGALARSAADYDAARAVAKTGERA